MHPYRQQELRRVPEAKTLHHAPIEEITEMEMNSADEECGIAWVDFAREKIAVIMEGKEYNVEQAAEAFNAGWDARGRISNYPEIPGSSTKQDSVELTDTEKLHAAELIALGGMNASRTHRIAIEEARGFGGWRDALGDARGSLSVLLERFEIRRRRE
jgi:hypothetical protein